MYSFENKPEMMECEEYGVKYREFLSTADITIIANEIMKYNEYHEREYVKNILMAKNLTDIPEDFDYEKHYDNMCESGFFNWLMGIGFYVEDEIRKNIEYNENIVTELTKLALNVNKLVENMPENFDKSYLKNKIIEMVRKNADK